MAFQYKARTDDDWERRASQQSGGFQGYILDDYRLYQLKKGENAIRILPPIWADAKHYGMDVFTHFGVGPDRATVLCPYKMASQPCPICEARAQAEKRGEDELVKELRPTRRVLVWVIDRKDEEKGPVVWGMPWSLDRDITKVSRDRTTGKFYEVDNNEQGYDIYFDRDGEGIGTKYTGVVLARRQTSVDPQWIDYVIAHPLTDTLLIRDYDEIKALFEGVKSASVEPRPVRQAANGAMSSDRPSSDRPSSDRPARPQSNRTAAEPPFDTGDPPPGEPPEEQDAEQDRPRPTAPAEREPAPAAASAAAASKAATLRERFARKGS